MEIIAMGVFTVFMIIWCSLKHFDMNSKLAAAYKAEDKRLHRDYRMESELQHELQCCRNQTREAKFLAEMMLAKNKKLEQDITCFRAELGLGPRLYEDSASLGTPFGLPMMPPTLGTPERLVKFTVERGNP